MKPHVARHKEAMKLRLRLKQEEADRLDSHGFGGDVDGLRAFLSHKFGGSVRGWRKAIAPGELGVASAFRSDFCSNLRKLGYTGQVNSLWKALVKRAGGQPSVGLEHLEPDLAGQLDAVAKRITSRFGGGALEAWKSLRRAHLARANFWEFEAFASEQKLVPKNAGVHLRRVFEALDLHGLGSISRDDFRFFDHWASRRFGAALPEEEGDGEPRWLEVEEHWSPPCRQPTPEPSLEDFRHFLAQKYGTAARAWRVALDLRGVGALSSSEFGKGCRCVGWKPGHLSIFKELARMGGGLATMRGADPDTAETIDKFNTTVSEKYAGDMHEFWVQVLDPDETGMVARTDFAAEVAAECDMTLEQSKLLFQVLDTSCVGYIAEVELAFVEVFESLLANMRRAQQHRAEAPVSMFHSASAPTLVSPSNSMFGGMLHSSGHSTAEVHPSSPMKSTRSAQARVRANTQRIKHKFVQDNMKHHWSIKSVQLAEDMREAKAAEALGDAGSEDEDAAEEDDEDDDDDEDEPQFDY